MSLRVSSLVLFAVLSGCASARQAAMPELAPLALGAVQAPPQLVENHFVRDRMALGEPELRQILEAPVFLEEHARIGVLPVRSAYAIDDAIPVEGAPATLTDALDGSGLFELASEISTEWPTTTGTAGLRELAARYRTEYVLLYRHRFADLTHANGFAAGFVTLVGALFLPGTTVDSAGVLEATLFDVKTGTILFTIHERVRKNAIAPPPAVNGTLDLMHREMVAEAAKKLAEQVLARCQRLVASRPAAQPITTTAR
ncbi:MAG: hypothetical protein QM817_05610 [Archangium sp.]